jgi:transposase
MEKELEQFQQEAQRLKAGRKGGSLPFPEALRAFAVRYAEHTLEGGGTVVEAAAKLGVSGPTLYEWRKGRTAGRPRVKPAQKSATLVPVRVEQRPAQGAVAGLPAVVVEALARHLDKSYEALLAEVFTSPLIHADETLWYLLDKGPGKKWYVWTVASPDAVYHRIFPSRSGATAKTVLGDFKGVVVVDGYAAYQTATKAGADGPAPATLAFCWAHVRRKFVEALRFVPACQQVLELIGQLYALEEDLPDWHALEGQAQQDALAHRLAVRQQHSVPLTERIQQWALSQKAMPDSTFRKALEYMLELWSGLTVFLLNPRVPLDNNHVERQMRDLVLGRKNHYGSKSQRGTEVAALFYSLIETAKLRGEDPGDYLLRAALAAIENPGTVTLPSSVD